jgi:hypothetical protein
VFKEYDEHQQQKHLALVNGEQCVHELYRENYAGRPHSMISIYFDNTWPYFLAADLETSLPLLVAAILLASISLIKILLMFKRKTALASKCSALL